MNHSPVSPTEPPSGARLRVAVAALLRARVDDDFVLIATGGRAVIAPPGGALTYHQATRPALASLEWRAECDAAGPLVDLRGTLPLQSFPAFVRWLEGGTGRETGPDGLRRGVRKELAEIGMPGLVDLVGDARLEYARTVVEGPTPALVGNMMQTRRVAVYDLLPCGLADALAAFALDPDLPTVHAVSEADIARGHFSVARISPQAAYLAADWADRPDATTLASPHGW